VKLPRMIFLRGAGEPERRHRSRPDSLAAQPYVRLNGLRVLVVDDEVDSNDVVGTVLGACGRTS